MKTLVTGGVRSGKSALAERLLEAEPVVTYVAPGPTPDEDSDPDWAVRIATHRARRPERWLTVETREVARAVRESRAPVVVDCLGTWLSAVLDESGGWAAPAAEAARPVEAALDELVEAVRASSVTVVIVTNEVGMGIVPEHRSGRLFRDLLGRVNQRVAEECDDVLLVVAGRAVRL
jgi:adenosylcobinamide kinase / adenosylcobinamide-phosphate guanylyltransferase